MYIYRIEEQIGEWDDCYTEVYLVRHKKKFTQAEFCHDVEECRKEIAGKKRTGRQKDWGNVGYEQFKHLLVSRFEYELFEATASVEL